MPRGSRGFAAASPQAGPGSTPDVAAPEPSPASAANLPPAVRDDPNPGLRCAVLHLAYDAGWLAFLVVSSPWLLWKSLRTPGFFRMVAGRLGWGLGRIPRRERPRVLIHGVSVGEVKAARSIVAALQERYPGLEVVLSSSTNTGLAVGRDLYPDQHVVRFPADLSLVGRRFLRRIDPAFVVLIELEIWPSFLRICNQRHCPVVVVNGRITEISHTRYLVFRKLLPQFNRISLFCVQSREYARRFRVLGVDERRILITGNVKVDGLKTGAIEPGEELRRTLGPDEGQLVLVAGSTHEPEELWVTRAWGDGTGALRAARLILVPRHPDRAPALTLRLEQEGFHPERLSELRARERRGDPRRPLVVDTIGELERIYSLADLVFVGGSLAPHGGQNMLEPAAQGRASVFGPHVRNFRQEAALLLEAGASRQVRDVNELGEVLGELAEDGEARERMGLRGVEAVRSQRGATERTKEALFALDLGVQSCAEGANPG